MSLKLTRWLWPVLVAVLSTFMLITPALAISPPDDISIDAVYVYRNCRETGDQLYLVEYTIDYASLPDESTSEAYLLRLMDGDDELQHTMPYAYYNKGYGSGVVALYFDADDAPDWEGVYTMQLLGNPFADWEGALPEDSIISLDFDIWQDNELGVTQTLVGGRIIDMALTLETDWGKDMVTVSDEGKQILTTYSTAYFINVIPNLYEIAPDIFAAGQGGWSGVIEPEIPDEETRLDYSAQLEANIIDTPLDLTPLGTLFGVSRGQITALLYYGVVAFVLILTARRLGTYKPLMLLSIPFVIVGAFIGVPLIVTVLAGLVALGMTAYVIFYKPSTA